MNFNDPLEYSTEGLQEIYKNDLKDISVTCFYMDIYVLFKVELI